MTTLQQKKLQYMANWLAEQSPQQTEIETGADLTVVSVTERIPYKDKTTADLELLPVKHDRIAARHYFLLGGQLSENPHQRQCIINTLLMRNNPNSFFVFGVEEDDSVCIFHQIKCDQPDEAFLDDYYKIRSGLEKFIEELPKILNDAIENCSKKKVDEDIP